MGELLKRPLPALAAVSTFSLAAWATVQLRANYLEWKAMGPGGVPYNAFGWAVQYLLYLGYGHNDTTDLDYPDKYLKNAAAEDRTLAERRFLPDLSERKGPGVRALPFAIPQRQRKAFTGLEMLEAQRKLFYSIAAENPDLVRVNESRLEPYDQALWLVPEINPPALAVKNRSEICHIHHTEGSCHVTLSCADSKEVISKGWGERHCMAGTFLNLGYTFVYAPRDDEEVEIMGKIFKAGIAFMSGGKEVA